MSLAPLAVIEEAGVQIWRIHFQGLVNDLCTSLGVPVQIAPPTVTGGYAFGTCAECGTETALYEGLCASHWMQDLRERGLL